MPYFVQLTKEGVVQRFSLENFPMTIGRQNDNEIVVCDTRISRHHARIERADGKLSITDLESTHRTYINSKVVEEKQFLRHGDRISLGKKIDFIFLDTDDNKAVEDYLLEIRHREGVGPESAYSTHVANQMNSLMDSINAKNMDTMVLKRINEEVRRSVSELKCLYEVGNAVNSEVDLDKVLDLIINHVIRATEGERGFIMLRDPNDPSKLIPMVAKEMEDNLDQVERFKFSTSIAKKALDTKECIVTKDTSADMAGLGHSIVDYNIRSAICAPLLSKGSAVGVLYVDAKESMKEFSDKDVDFFSALANQSAIAIENAQLYKSLRASIDKLDRKVQELTALYSISKSLMNVSDLNSVLSTILDKSIETIGTERGSIMLYADGEDALEVKVIRGSLVREDVVDRIRIRKDEGIAGKVISTGVGIIDNEGSRSAAFKKLTDRESDIKQILCVPLTGNKEIIGVINLINRTGGKEFTQDDLQLLTSIANQAAVTIENTRLYDLAVYDGLTRVHIRRYFDAWLIKEFERAKRYGSNLSIILVDIDHFKHINDTYGHPTGDHVLIEMAKVFKDSVRAVDIVARYGGEEFIIGLPETSLEGAELFANRLRQKMEVKTMQHQGHILNITVSMGVSNVRQGYPTNLKQLIKMADLVLYEAKAGGRNRVCAFRPEERGKI